jgi:tetratricopeptide (TPR) repeat protein
VENTVNKYVVGLIGLILGFIVSFFWTQSYNSQNVVASPGARASAPGGGGGQPNQQAVMGDIRETLEKAKANPKDYDAQVAAARSYAQIGRSEEAVEYLEKAYEADPAKTAAVGALPYIGDHYFSQKKFAEAEMWLRRAVEVEPRNADLYVMVAETYTMREPPNPDKAAQELQRALAIDPKNDHALAHLIDAYLLKKDARAAEDALNRLKEANPGSPKISTYQGLVADLKAGKPVSIPKE